MKTGFFRLPKLYFFFSLNICDALRDLVPFVPFKKHEKHSWRSVTSNKTYNFTKSNTPP